MTGRGKERRGRRRRDRERRGKEGRERKERIKREERGGEVKGMRGDGRTGKRRGEKRAQEGVQNLRKTTPVIRWLGSGLLCVLQIFRGLDRRLGGYSPESPPPTVAPPLEITLV